MLSKGLITTIFCVTLIQANATDLITKAIGLIGGLMVVLVQFSTLKKRFVDEDFGGSWVKYFKSLVVKPKKTKNNGRKKNKNKSID